MRAIYRTIYRPASSCITGISQDTGNNRRRVPRSSSSAAGIGYDQDAEAIDYAEEHYRHIKVMHAVRDLKTLRIWKPAAARLSRGATWGTIGVQACGLVAAFEIIEHSPAAPAFLAHAARRAWLLVGSVPNEELVPFRPGKVNPEHYRHYTPDEIRAELEACGWRLVMLGGQTGKHGPGAVVRRDTAGARTLVFVAKSMHLEEPGG